MVRAPAPRRWLALWGAALLGAACGSSPSAAPSGSSGSIDLGSGLPAVTGDPLPATSAVTTTPPSSRPPRSTTTRPDATDAPTTPPTDAPDTAAECLAALPTTFLAQQVVWPAVYGDQLDAGAQYGALGVGGVVLMSWPEGGAPALAEFRAGSPLPLLIATDEEGGDVQRLDALGELPSARTVAETMPPDAARDLIAGHARQVADLGIDIVFAPVVDVAPLFDDGPIGDRSFGADPAVVSAYAQAYVDGWQSAGILPVLKHFPGHGSASADTHDGVGVTPSLGDLQQRDLVPYRDLVDAGAGVMVGHLDVPGLTDEDGLPASLSPAAVTFLLRGQLGYTDALVFSDALGMDAITARHSIADAAVMSLAAGVDVVIFTDTEQTGAVIGRVTEAADAGLLPAGRLQEAAGRVLAEKGVSPCDVV